MDNLIAQRVLVRDLPDRSRIIATLRVEQLGGNSFPHFSATCSVWEARGSRSGAARQRAGQDIDSGGADRAAILAAFPGAAAFVAMHLADYPSGRPMHALANGWYFLNGQAERYELEKYGPAYVEPLGTPATRCASYLRCEPRDLPHDILSTPPADRGETPELRDRFAAFVDAQAPRWAAEARAAVDLLALMPDATNLRGYDVAGEPIDRVPLPSWLIGADPEPVNV